MLLFRDDESKASDPWNPCKLCFRHVLLLALIRKKYNPTQGILQAHHLAVGVKHVQHGTAKVGPS